MQERGGDGRKRALLRRGRAQERGKSKRDILRVGRAEQLRKEESINHIKQSYTGGIGAKFAIEVP